MIKNNERLEYIGAGEQMGSYSFYVDVDGRREELFFPDEDALEQLLEFTLTEGQYAKWLDDHVLPPVQGVGCDNRDYVIDWLDDYSTVQTWPLEEYLHIGYEDKAEYLDDYAVDKVSV